MTSNAIETKIDGLLKKMKSKKVSDKRGAIFALSKIEPEGIVYLGKVMKKEKFDLRAEIVRAVGDMATFAVTALLEDALVDSHHDVRRAAAESLAKIKNPASVTSLCAILSDDSVDVRKEVIWSLFKIKDARAVLPLTQKLLDDDKYVRVRAATVLGAFSDERAVEALVMSLNDDTDVCLEALRSLGKIGGEQAWGAIAKMDQHHDDKVRQVVIGLLKERPSQTSDRCIAC